MQTAKFKLIKEYPYSNKLGYTFTAVTIGTIEHYRKYPEFWEEVEEEPKKVYQILEVACSDDSRLYLCDNGKYHAYKNNPGVIEEKNILYDRIVSVKILRSGEVYSIGDRTQYGVITEFRFADEEYSNLGATFENSDWHTLIDEDFVVRKIEEIVEVKLTRKEFNKLKELLK